MDLIKNLTMAAICSVALSVGIGAGPGRAMEFNVSFDLNVGSPTPTSPIVGRGIFGFDQTLTDGSYYFKDLTNVYMSYEFIPGPPPFDNNSYFYNFYDLPNPIPPDPSNPFPNTNFDYLYAPNLKVVIYNNGTQFYFDGPSVTNYNVGSLDLNMKQGYIDLYYPGKSPIFLSFQPNNPGVPPILPPYNQYGIYANIDATSTTSELVVNGTYGTVVPGPLPLAGAATAFSLSRRMRRRLKSAS
jgi:hypothetical protein